MVYKSEYIVYGIVKSQSIVCILITTEESFAQPLNVVSNMWEGSLLSESLSQSESKIDKSITEDITIGK